MIDYQTWFAHKNYTGRVCRLSTKDWKMSCGPFGFITSVTAAMKRMDCTGSAEDETWTVMVVERHCSLLLSEQPLSYVLSNLVTFWQTHLPLLSYWTDSAKLDPACFICVRANESSKEECFFFVVFFKYTSWQQLLQLPTGFLTHGFARLSLCYHIPPVKFTVSCILIIPPPAAPGLGFLPSYCL